MRFIKKKKKQNYLQKLERAVGFWGFRGGGGWEATEGNLAEQHRLVVL